MPNEFVKMRNPANGSVDEIPAGAADAYERKGFERLTGARSYAQADQERVEAELAAEAELARAGDAAEDIAETVDERTVDQVLADVGNDPDLAQAALTAEWAGRNRSTLTAQLEHIIAAGQTGDTEED
jgi:hypothetical protein